MSILDATHREAVRLDAVEQAGRTAEEVEDAGVGAINRTAPTVAVGTHSAERTIVVEAAARQRQFQR